MIRHAEPSLDALTPAIPDRAVHNLDGIVLLDKPLGLSSNQALQRVKRLFGAAKAGHTGSLDPLATGMLPICLGQATKFSAYLLDSDKSYRVTIAFGMATSTGDAEGSPVATGPAEVSEASLHQVLPSFLGSVTQIPPMHSALKYKGKRLYELARAGQEVPRPARMIQIHELAIETYDPARPVLHVRCGKGTYIRTLVEDIARAAGTVGHVAALRRLSVGSFAESMMSDFRALSAAQEAGQGALESLLIPPDEALRQLPARALTGTDSIRLRNGQAVPSLPPHDAGMVRLYGPDGVFLGLGEYLESRQIVPRRLMTGL